MLGRVGVRVADKLDPNKVSDLKYVHELAGKVWAGLVVLLNWTILKTLFMVDKNQIRKRSWNYCLDNCLSSSERR